MTTAERSTKHDDLAYESARNETYLSELARKVYRPAIATSANNRWTGSGQPSARRPDSGALLGRVGLGDEDSDLGDNFYIGSWHHESGDLRVFSWAAPIARAFFGEVDVCADGIPIVVRRTFSVGSGDRIVDLSDDWVGRPLSASPFAQRARLTMPTPPPAVRPTAALPAARSTPPARQEPAETPPAEVTRVEPSSAAAKPPAVRPVHVPVPARVAPTEPRRAADAVRAALAAPRSEGLSSVLSTLQPDQYALVTHPADRPLIVQGHPGTGKTIVALHRAAFLVNPERAGATPLRVLLVGPTKDYVTHVRAALDALIEPGSVTITNLQRSLFELAGLDAMPPGSLDGSATDVDLELGELIDAAAARFRQVCRDLNEEDVAGGVALLWAALRAHNGWMQTRRLSGALRDWLLRLPEYEEAVMHARFLPALAYCGLALFGSGNLRFDHLVIDEAQDVRPLEWRILQRLNIGGGWTLVGDTNQRRADHCDTNWKSVAVRLNLKDEGNLVEPSVMMLGYRSTRQIMLFANRLLPTGSRRLSSIQNGPNPAVVRAKGSQLMPVVLQEALALGRRHSGGLTAVITVAPDPVRKYLRAAGWRLGENPNNFTKDGVTLHVRRPDHARGVEYDGVVVVEPFAFPRNTGGRWGALYTSLTRANRELVVVHALKMPKELTNTGLSDDRSAA